MEREELMRLFLQNRATKTLKKFEINEENYFFENKNFENKKKEIWVIFLRTRLTNRINSGDFEYEMSICGESSSLKFRRIDV